MEIHPYEIGELWRRERGEERGVKEGKREGRVESWFFCDQLSLIKPCMRFSRTRLSDVLHRMACA